jgi:predicted site-specific integrase-resolvase
MKPRFGKLPDQAEAKYNRLTLAEAEEAVRKVIRLGDSEVLLGVLEVLQTYTKEQKREIAEVIESKVEDEMVRECARVWSEG